MGIRFGLQRNKVTKEMHSHVASHALVLHMTMTDRPASYIIERSCPCSAKLCMKAVMRPAIHLPSYDMTPFIITKIPLSSFCHLLP